MKSLLSTPALAEKICDMKDRRAKANTWSADDEQILAFLVELHILRISKAHADSESKGITEIIYKLHDEMQDERGLLIR